MAKKKLSSQLYKASRTTAKLGKTIGDIEAIARGENIIERVVKREARKTTHKEVNKILKKIGL